MGRGILFSALLSWVSALLESVGDEGPALVVESDDALLLLLAQPQLDHLAALFVDRILRGLVHGRINSHIQIMSHLF